MKEDRNGADLMVREAEQELEERYATFGPPSPVSDALRDFMRGQYVARVLEKAAQSGRCEGMKPAPIAPGVGFPHDHESVTSRERLCAQTIEAMRVGDLAEQREKP